MHITCLVPKGQKKVDLPLDQVDFDAAQLPKDKNASILPGYLTSCLTKISLTRTDDPEPKFKIFYGFIDSGTRLCSPILRKINLGKGNLYWMTSPSRP